jgi:hypothetical protein
MPTLNNSNGQAASITSDGRLMVSSYDEPVKDVLNGWAFYLIDPTVTPTGAGDYWMHVENDSADPLVITRIAFTPVGAEEFQVCLAEAYTPATSTTAFPSTPNRHFGGSSNAFSTKGTAICDADITGQGTVHIIRQLDSTANTEVVIDWSDRPVVLGTNTALLMLAGTGTAAITNVCVDCHFMVEPSTDA